jgi:hypothetical protein
MSTYPSYDVDSTVLNGNRCTVTVSADTTCGPKIKAKSTVTRAAKESDAKLKQEAERIAARNLKSENTVVVNSCKADGKHKGH